MIWCFYTDYIKEHQVVLMSSPPPPPPPPCVVLGTQQEDVETLVEKLSELLPVTSSTMCLRQDFREEVHRYTPSLIYVEDLSWPGLGAVR